MDKISEEILIEKYYRSFLSFLQAVGAHQSILKLSNNLDDGVYPAQVVARQYGYEGARLEIEIHARDKERWWKLQELNHWSHRVGLGQMNLDGMDALLTFVEDYDRRRYLRDNIRRLMKKHELLSMRDLMQKRLELEKKRKGNTFY